ILQRIRSFDRPRLLPGPAYPLSPDRSASLRQRIHDDTMTHACGGGSGVTARRPERRRNDRDREVSTAPHCPNSVVGTEAKSRTRSTQIPELIGTEGR